jgi:hypothetical protein
MADAIARLALVVVAVATLAWPAETAGSQQQPDHKRQVQTAIQEAIRLLEAKQHLEFVKTFMRPNEVERLVAKFGTVDNLAAEFGKDERAGTLLKALQTASKLEPMFNSTNTSARFTFETPIGRERGLLLQKIGDRWYIAD